MPRFSHVRPAPMASGDGDYRSARQYADTMSFLFSLFLVLHLICWAVALGTWVSAARTREPNPGMAHATAGALVFGIVLRSEERRVGKGGELGGGRVRKEEHRV